jgi:2-methylcitrate dehydratase PrpD
MVAAWIAGLRHEQVPQPVRDALRRLVLDTLGDALFGRDQSWTEAVRNWAVMAAPAAGTRQARLWGEPGVRMLRPADAALVNGTAAHAYELDDYHNAKLHPGAVVVPAAIALGEALDADGAKLETAIAAGYEVMIRSALALGPGPARLRGWHLTAVCGPMGAAAAAAVLLGLDEERTAWALGLAGTQSGGLFAFTADGTASKRFHPGRAAQSGIMAAELAALGLSGPTKIYEAADGGLLSTFVDKSDAAQLTAGLGSTWHGADTSFKPYSCCASLHAHVDAALELRPRWRQGGRVRVGLARVVEVQCGYDYEAGSELNSQMSARYCVAVALIRGAVLPAQFAPESIADAQVTQLAKAMELVHDPALDQLYPEHFAGWVECETAEGRIERSWLRDPSGSPVNPGMQASLRRKFHSLVDPILGEARSARLAGMADDLDHCSTRELLQGLVL